MSCDHELANEKTRCSGKNANYITKRFMVRVCARVWLTHIKSFLMDSLDIYICTADMLCNSSVFILLQTAFYSDRKPGYSALIQLMTLKKAAYCALAMP